MLAKAKESLERSAKYSVSKEDSWGVFIFKAAIKFVKTIPPLSLLKKFLG